MKIEHNKITFPNMVKVKLTKIEERGDAEVPNNIPVNDTRVGYVRKENLIPKEGESYVLLYVIEKNGEYVHPGHWFVTSCITNVRTENKPNTPLYYLIHTLNSVYKLEIV